MPHDANGVPPQPISEPDKNSDQEEKEPQFIASRRGRMVSLQGLVERIVEEFAIEHGEGDSEAVKAIVSDVERRKLVRDVADYILGVESVRLSPQEQAYIMKASYAEVFGYGPLDDYLNDPTITTITLEGAQKMSVRRGIGKELEAIDPIFETLAHMQRMLKRMVRRAGAELRDDISIIEVGLDIGERRASLSLAAPPLVAEMAADIRLHPTEVPTFDDWASAGIINEKSATLVQAIIQSEHGLLIVGDTESGKTTLLSMLLAQLPALNIITVERTGELTLPENAERRVVQWRVGDEEGVTFGTQIRNALEENPDLIVLDEVRTDEPAMIAPLLANDDTPRQIWSFRGTTVTKRLQSALGMLARMSDSTQSEHMVYKLHRRLPFVVSLKHRQGQLQVCEIAEWQFSEASADDTPVYADYVPLLEFADTLTGKHPQNLLDLPETFWTA
ncbi:MAG: ATPase, T2SS/T4P/T4SS family [Chloroflexota bacterium]